MSLESYRVIFVRRMILQRKLRNELYKHMTGSRYKDQSIAD